MYRAPLLFIRATLCIALPFALPGCSAVSGSGETPSLPAPPLAYDAPLSDARDVAVVLAPERLTRLPDGTGLLPEGVRLPGAALNNRGAVRALVFPVSLGKRRPAWSDSTIAYEVVGAPGPPTDLRPAGAAGRLYEASQGLFHLDASVFPPLVDVAAQEAPLFQGGGTAETPALEAFARRITEHWAGRVNLAAFDNDGPDGHPMSGDDDGALDLVVLAVETDSTPAITTVPIELHVGVGQDSRLDARIAEVAIMTLPATGVLDPGNLGATALLLHAMGLEAEEMFFPATYPRAISTLARVRLGWVTTGWAPRSGRYGLESGQVAVVPVVDVGGHRGLWLIERMDDTLFLTRIARKPSGHFGIVSMNLFRPGLPDLLVPLTREQGEMGPRFRVRWELGAGPTLVVALSDRAVRADEEALDREARPGL